MHQRRDEFGDDDGAVGTRGAADFGIRQGLIEIREAIDHLERTCRQGRITPAELAEERELLTAQQRSFERRR
jgi:hypothetical protein